MAFYGINNSVSRTRGSNLPRGIKECVMALMLMVGAVALSPTLARAHSYNLGKVMIGHFWAPPVGAEADGAAVYGPFLNNGSNAVTLVGASSPVADQVRFRKIESGVVTWLDKIELLPKRPVGLAKWREHIWLSGLKRPLKEGDTIPLELDFGDTGHITIDVVIESMSGH